MAQIDSVVFVNTAYPVSNSKFIVRVIPDIPSVLCIVLYKEHQTGIWHLPDIYEHPEIQRHFVLPHENLSKYRNAK